MIGTILKFEPKSKITLLYANRTADTIIFNDQENNWAKEHQNKLEIKHYLSEEENPLNAVKGYITRNSLEELINCNGRDKIDFYLCGPEIMTNKLIEDLAYLGIPKESIHRELFLITAKNQVTSCQKSKVTAKIFGKTYHFETKEGKTILQSGLAQDVPLPFSCQYGLCGTCKMKCTEGKIKMLNNQILTEQEIKAGYILTCQSLPQTKEIHIKQS